MINAVIVEDELHGRETLKNMVQEFCPDVNIVAMAESVETGMVILQKHHPDLVFLDIEMQSSTGFDLLERVQNLEFEVIFTTAYEHYALKAIKFSAIDYLLKPIDIGELQVAVQKVVEKKGHEVQNQKLTTLLNNMQATNQSQHKITLSTAEGYQFIPVTDVIYCEADGSYTHFHLKGNKKLTVSKHLKEYEGLLQDYNFFRVHQSFLVNLSEVEKFVRTEGGYLVMQNGAQIAISNKKREEFINLMRYQ